MKLTYVVATLLIASATAFADRKDDSDPNSSFFHQDVSPSGYTGRLDQATEQQIKSVADADAEAMRTDPLFASFWVTNFDWDHPATSSVIYDEICAIAASYHLAADDVPDDVSQRWEVYISEMDLTLREIHEKNPPQSTK